MTDPTPDKPFVLPQDVAALTQLHEQLADYLDTLEKNTVAVETWLKNNGEKIILAHHQLFRALAVEKDETKALAVLDGMSGDIAGFVAGMQDFAALGGDQFKAALDRIKPGIPQGILKKLPEVDLAGFSTTFSAGPDAGASQASKEKEKSKFSLSNLFRGDRKEKEREEAARREAEKTVQTAHRLQKEIIALQSDRHLYVKSFMEWVGEVLAPSEPGADVSALMKRYQDPDYVIDHAQREFADAVGRKVDLLRREALDYSAIACLIDNKNIEGFAQMLPSLFPAAETNESARQKRLLLADFGAESFTQLALDKIEGRANQFALFQAATKHEQKLSSGDEKFVARVIDEVTAPNDRLDARALFLALSHAGGKSPAECLGEDPGACFSLIAKRLENDPKALRNVLHYLMLGLQASGSHARKAELVVDFSEALKKQDDIALLAAMDSMSAPAFKALWRLCYPQSSLLADITAAIRDPLSLAHVAQRALERGLLDEIRIGRAPEASFDTFRDFFESRVLTALDEFPASAARVLIAAAFTADGLDRLRESLTKAGGWLETVMDAKIPERKKIEWAAALVEPFRNDITKAAILCEARDNALTQNAAQTLTLMEENLTGETVRLDEDRILTNLDRIANVWYNPQEKHIKYTVTGIASIVMENVEPGMAEDIFTVIKRRGGFESEYFGLFKPALIDKFLTKEGKTEVFWQKSNNGNLHAAENLMADIHSRPDFLHCKPENGTVSSINVSSILLIEKRQDGSYLLVNKYGQSEVLQGCVTLPQSKELIAIGDTLVNPSSASILSLNRAEGKIQLRVESGDFDNFLEQEAPEKFLYPIAADAADFSRMEAALKKDGRIVSPGGSVGKFHFNLGALGYMNYEETEHGAGFSCKTYALQKSGFIPMERNLAREILAGLREHPNVITAGNALSHRDCVDDAYYHAEHQKLYFFIGSKYVEIRCNEIEAIDALRKISAIPGFEVISYRKIPNPDGAGVIATPVDVANFTRTTMMRYGEEAGRIAVTAEHQSYPLNFDRANAHELFAVLEKRGLAAARQKAKTFPWTAQLRETLGGFPPLEIKAHSCLAGRDSRYLLNEALTGQEGKNTADIALKEHFSAAQKPLRINGVFIYPQGRASKPPAAKARRPK